MKTAPLKLLLLAMAIFALCTCSKPAPLQSITPAQIPFSMHFIMRDGDARRFQLPSGKQISVWCERPDIPSVGEQQTASGLKTAWGERPFRRPDIRWKPQPDGSQVSDGWYSYIEQGAVITSDDRTSEYILFVDKYQFSITEDLRARTDLPITINITRRTEPTTSK